MREQGVDMWIVPVREYNEDPVFFSLVSPTTMAARRRTIYVFFDRGPERGVERIAIGGTSQGGLYTVVRDPTRRGYGGHDARAAEPFGPEQWRLLTPLVEARDPRASPSTSRTRTPSRTASRRASGSSSRRPSARVPGPRGAARAAAAAVHRGAAAGDAAGLRRMQELVHEIIATAFSNRSSRRA
jgi:hypothetical protein